MCLQINFSTCYNVSLNLPNIRRVKRVYVSDPKFFGGEASCQVTTYLAVLWVNIDIKVLTCYIYIYITKINVERDFSFRSLLV